MSKITTIPPTDPAALRDYAEAEIARWQKIVLACDQFLTAVASAGSALASNGAPDPPKVAAPANEALARFLREKHPLRQLGLAVLLLFGPNGTAGILKILGAHGATLPKKRAYDFLYNSLKPEHAGEHPRLLYQDKKFSFISDEARRRIAEELGIEQ